MDDPDDLDVEVLDDELFPTPAKDADAPGVKPTSFAPPRDLAPSAPSSSSSTSSSSLPPLTTGARARALGPLPALGASRPAPGPGASTTLGARPASASSSGASTPTAAALAARDEAERAKRLKSVSVTGSAAGPGAGDDDDDDDSSSSSSSAASSDGEIEVFERPSATAAPVERAPAARSPATASPRRGPGPGPAPVPVAAARAAAERAPAIDALGDDDVDIAFDDEEASHAPRVQRRRRHRRHRRHLRGGGAAEASRVGVEKLADRYVDKFDLEIEDEAEAAAAATFASAKGGGEDEEDEFADEFGYAFEGKAREGKTHRKEFVAKPMPKTLVTDVKSMPMEAFAEGDEEEEEEEEEEAEAEEEEEAEAEEADAEETAAEEAIELEVGADSSEAADGGGKSNARTSTAERAGSDSEASSGDEWDEANAARTEEEAAVEKSRSPSSKEGDVAVETPWSITRAEAKAKFEAADVSKYLPDLIVEEENPGGGFSCFSCFGAKPARLDASLEGDRERFFAVAKMPFADDDGDGTHARILQTVFARLTGGDRPVPRYGSHWERVGFQGKDPATDLRGCGMLALEQLLALTEDDPPSGSGAGGGSEDAARRNRVFENAAAIHALSRDPAQEFPMAPLGVNLTHITLKAVRKGLLNADANARGSLWNAADVFYRGAFYEFYLRWRDGKKTIADSGHARRELEEFLLTKKGAKRAMELAESGELLERGGGEEGEGEGEGGAEEFTAI